MTSPATYPPVPQDLAEILDKAAGKAHSDTGPVMRCLAEILHRHEQRVRAQIADELEERYGPFAFMDDQDEAVVNVIRHLRGQCAICGRAPEAEPCGHAHGINLREGR